jgi:uncharacterized protein (DUF1800 family)
MRILLIFFLIMVGVVNVGNAQQYTRTIGEGDYLDVVVTTSNSSGNSSPVVTLDGLGLMPNLVSASRFLAQSTLGADMEAIASTAQLGFTRWIDQQLNTPVSYSLLQNGETYIKRYRAYLSSSGQDTTLADGDGSYWVENYFLFSWWKYVMESPDILRAKVALALSEIIVVSAYPDLMSQPLGLSSFYDLLIRNSFGNYRDLLYEVTMHPIMGRYLTYLNNRKTNVGANRFPDENYAREIMQLFTIGLYELNQDGSQKLDNTGNPIPTYDIDDIREFAKIFTGLSYGDRPKFGESGSLVKYRSCTIPLKMFNNEHEPGEKYLLNGFVVPARNPVDGMADIDDAIDNLFNHPNVGPFLSRRLIQRLVSSNPSPAYISRVAGVFNDNGFGERGDLKAVVKAILTDPEARSCKSDAFSGKLKEPIHRQLQLFRGFNATTPAGVYRFSTSEGYFDAAGQRALNSPTVFNFFLPDYAPVGPVANAGIYAPEFQIINSATLVGYANYVHRWTFEGKLAGSTELYPEEDPTEIDAKLKLSLADELQLLSEGKTDELLERLNLILMQGQMSEVTREVILNAIDEVKGEGADFQLNMAIYLTMISPEYLVMQ